MPAFRSASAKVHSYSFLLPGSIERLLMPRMGHALTQSSHATESGCSPPQWILPCLQAWSGLLATSPAALACIKHLL